MKKILFFFCVQLCACGLLLAGAFAEESAAQVNQLPKELRNIGEEAFAGTAMEAMELPGSVLSIGSAAFGDMPNLREILFSGPVRLITDRGLIRLDGGNFPVPSGSNSDMWTFPAAVPSADSSGRGEAEAVPAGTTGEETPGRPRRSIAARSGIGLRLPERAVFHPLNLYFP